MGEGGDESGSTLLFTTLLWRSATEQFRVYYNYSRIETQTWGES